MLEVGNLMKHYLNNVTIGELNFTARQGQVVGLLGPNGAGKTTTIRMIAGVLSPTSGTARIDGKDIVSQRKEAQARIGYLPESPSLYDEMTVEETLTFFAKLKLISGRERAAEVARVIDETDLGALADRLCGALSRGFQQRVAFAQALIGDPSLLVLDEPTAGMDPIQIGRFREQVRTLARKHCVLLSTHILQEASELCSHIVVMSHGRVLAHDSRDAIQARAAGADQVVELHIREPVTNLAETLRSAPNITEVFVRIAPDGLHATIRGPSKQLAESVSRLVVDRGWTVLALATRRATLEEAFFSVLDKLG